MSIRHFIHIAALLSCFPCFSQELWTSAEFQKSLGKNWGAGAKIEYRTHDKLSSTERISTDFICEYKFSFLKVDAGYKYILGQTLEDTTPKGNIIPPYWTNRHRAYMSLTGRVNFGRFSLSLRERYQFTHRTGKWVPEYASDGITAKNDEWVPPNGKHIFRSRLFCDYSIRKSRFTPFASIEVYDNLTAGFAVEKIRYTVGSEYKFDKHNRIKLFYKYIQRLDAVNESAHVAGIGYSFRL